MWRNGQHHESGRDYLGEYLGRTGRGGTPRQTQEVVSRGPQKEAGWNQRHLESQKLRGP